ncbi:MAG TPA: ankyrin repeat domain-containing protein [Tahibacter sp.]|uniref:ankyrin repeat domain-containing protein n=1 Tax=Tahibacter sp. TaxID=2056211 RepID=UPI002BDD204F|nr:ankyrin repeat domain-containing protein [Tahibacter sp.]HSX60706.1 ankyrin repeat domain-containing protein [Tahibacter sp.]
MRIGKIVIAALLGGSAMLAAAQDAAKPRMSREQAEKIMEEDGTSVVQDNLPVNLFNAKAQIVEAMIVLGVDPNGKLEMTPQTTLEFAIQACMDTSIAEADVLATIAVLLREGARPNDTGMMGTLILAAQQCTPAVVKQLVAGGAALDQRTPQGFTPLSMALIVGRYDNAEALVDAGAKLSAEAAGRLREGAEGNERLLALIKRATRH